MVSTCINKLRGFGRSTTKSLRVSNSALFIVYCLFFVLRIVFFGVFFVCFFVCFFVLFVFDINYFPFSNE